MENHERPSFSRSTAPLPQTLEAQVLIKALGSCPLPVVVLDSSLRVCFLNDEAGPLFSASLGQSPFEALRTTGAKRAGLREGWSGREQRLQELRDSMIGRPLTPFWHPISATRFTAATAQLQAVLQTKDDTQLMAHNMILCRDPKNPSEFGSLKVRVRIHAVTFSQDESALPRNLRSGGSGSREPWYFLYFHRDADSDLRSDMSTPSQEFKEILLDNALDVLEVCVFAGTSDGEVVGLNKAARQMFSAGGEAVELGDHQRVTLESFSRFNFLTPDFSQPVESRLLPIINTCMLGMETRPTTIGLEIWDSDSKDGTLMQSHLITIWGKPVKDQMGNHLGGICFFENVSEKNRLEEIQRNLAAKVKAGDIFNTLADAMPLVVWTVRPDGLCDYFNKRFQEKIHDIDDAVGHQWIKLIHPEDRPKFLQRWFQAYTDNTRFFTQARIMYRDQLWHWNQCMALPYFDEDGRTARWMGVWVDIDAERQALAQAQSLRSQIHNVAKHAKVLIWSVDQNKIITLGEGLDAANEAVGKHISELEMSPEILQAIDNILSGQAKSIFIQPEWKDRFHQTYLTALYEEEDHSPEGSAVFAGVACISIDMTETNKTQRALEESLRHRRELEASETAAKEANRLKSEFLANTSHEIRTPIAGVLGMAELLMDTDGLTTQQKGFTVSIFKSASSLLGTINQLLDYSKMESGHMEIEDVPFNLRRVISDTEEMLSHAFRRKGLKWIREDHIRYMGTVVGDPGRLRQILTNFVSNAIKFTKEGSVTLRVVEESEDYEETMRVRISVTDTGIGLSKTALQRLFKPFSQADSSMSRLYGGTGLGLSICKSLAELMNGSIGLVSEPGKGTTIWASLPLKKAQDSTQDRLALGDLTNLRAFSSSPELALASSAQGSPPIKEAAAAKGTHNLWILVAEDNPIMQTIAIKNLEKMGFNVRAVSNGKLAVEEAAQRQYDLILMDCQMPEMDGYEATRQIRLRSAEGERRIPIVALTASAIRGDRDRCINSGMDDYLAKPVKSFHLQAMIQKWLGLHKQPAGSSDGHSQRSDSGRSDVHHMDTSMSQDGIWDGSSNETDSTMTTPGDENMPSAVHHMNHVDHQSAPEGQHYSNSPMLFSG